jgi:hypothetical protein
MYTMRRKYLHEQYLQLALPSGKFAAWEGLLQVLLATALAEHSVHFANWCTESAPAGGLN